MTTGKALNGKPYAGNPHVRFDEGADAPKRSGCSALLCNKRKLAWRAAVSAAAICVAAVALPSWAADRTISANYVLTTDETVDGVLTVDAGVTVDLNGHNLTVGGLASTALAMTNDIAVGYAGLTHLETDGGQYVVLSDYSLAPTDRVEMCVRFLSPVPREQFLFGSRAGAKNRAFYVHLNNNDP